ncbi:hypothetical protein JL721_7903 [Aureococcus anophagefferens]|nr:hypothetical protein JL721_7903 [Aureococcus anophagefferens]
MARLLLLSLVVAFAGAFAPSTLAPRAAALTVVDGRGDKRTKRGKVYAGSNGVSRSKPKKYFSIREWGKAQDPPMSVEEVVASKVADLNKVAMTQEELIDALTRWAKAETPGGEPRRLLSYNRKRPVA